MMYTMFDGRWCIQCYNKTLLTRIHFLLYVVLCIACVHLLYGETVTQHVWTQLSFSFHLKTYKQWQLALTYTLCKQHTHKHWAISIHTNIGYTQTLGNQHTHKHWPISIHTNIGQSAYIQTLAIHKHWPISIHTNIAQSAYTQTLANQHTHKHCAISIHTNIAQSAYTQTLPRSSFLILSKHLCYLFIYNIFFKTCEWEWIHQYLIQYKTTLLTNMPG